MAPCFPSVSEEVVCALDEEAISVKTKKTTNFGFSDFTFRTHRKHKVMLYKQEKVFIAMFL